MDFFYPSKMDVLVVSCLLVFVPWIMLTLMNKVIHDWWKSDGNQYPTWDDFLFLPRNLYRFALYCDSFWTPTTLSHKKKKKSKVVKER